jgi:heavy metal sensor kinase
MSSEKRPELVRTLAFRLTLWYGALFVVTAGVAFLFFYILMTGVIRQGIDQDLEAEVRSLATMMRSRGVETAQRQAALEAQAAGEKKLFFRFLYRNGQAFSSSNMSYFRDIGVSRSALRQLLANGEPVYDTFSAGSREHQVRILYALVSPRIILQVGQSMENQTRIIEAFQRMFVVTMAALFVLAAVVGWFMARRALGGVERVTMAARRISDGSSLGERVPVGKRDDEIDQLATTFNQMLDRIQGLVAGIREMSDNIAHDLKSPITRVRGGAEIALTGAASNAEFEQMAASTIEECDRLLETINTMLLISRTEAGAVTLNLQTVELGDIIEDACALLQASAQAKGLVLQCRVIDRMAATGDLRLIQRMVANLIDNAIQYTEKGGIELVLRRSGDDRAEISISDTGIGISDEDQQLIFDRFYRCDPSRSESGSGLGLSFARAVARAHGGDISVASRLEKGTIFTVRFPAGAGKDRRRS